MRRVSPGTTGLRKRAFSMATSSTSLLARSSMAFEHQHAGTLRHRFHDQDAGITGKSGK